MWKEHTELSRLMSAVKEHMAISLNLIKSTKSAVTKQHLEETAFNWLESYLKAFYSEQLTELATEIYARPGLILKPINYGCHHWNVTLYQKKMIVYCDRLVAPIDLEKKVDYTDFWGLVNTPGMHDLIVRGLVYPMPRRFNTLQAIPGRIEEARPSLPIEDFTFDLNDDLPGEEFSVTAEEIKLAFSDAPLQGIFVPLPHVANLDLDMVLNLREEYEDEWIRFQGACKRILRQSPSVNAEAKILDMAKEIDQRVRELNARVEGGRFLNKREGVILSIGLAGFVLALVSPSQEVRSAIAAALGSFTAAQGIRFFTSKREIENKLQADSDFFFPWKVSQLDQAEAKKKH